MTHQPTRVEITLGAAKLAMRWQLISAIDTELRAWGVITDGTEAPRSEKLAGIVEAVLTDPKTVKGVYGLLSEWATS